MHEVICACKLYKMICSVWWLKPIPSNFNDMPCLIRHRTFHDAQWCWMQWYLSCPCFFQPFMQYPALSLWFLDCPVMSFNLLALLQIPAVLFLFNLTAACSCKQLYKSSFVLHVQRWQLFFLSRTQSSASWNESSEQITKTFANICMSMHESVMYSQNWNPL